MDMAETTAENETSEPGPLAAPSPTPPPSSRIPFMTQVTARIAETRITAGRVSIAVLSAALAAFALLAYHRRWIADDGLIATRTVRQLLAGHGPVFNQFERTEADTSTLWTYLLALFAGIFGGDVARTAVWLGLALAVFGAGLALFTTRRFQLRLGGPDGSQLVLPLGFLVLLAVSPFWDFATSGLETGLETAWIAALWCALTRVGADSGRRAQLGAAVLLGLGPLVRPDFALITAVFAVGLWLVLRPTWRRTLMLVAAGVALPLAYEVFRAGYYATLVPMPALAKSATGAQWTRGMQYFEWFFGGYLLYLPLLVIAVLLGKVLGRDVSTADRVRIFTPIAAGVIEVCYVVRVGGDFMMARMCLPAVFLVLLPVLCVPVGRSLAPYAAAVAAWSMLCVATTHDQPYQVGRNGMFLGDERADYQIFTHNHNPDDTADYLREQGALIRALQKSDRTGRTLILLDEAGTAPLDPRLPFRHAVEAGRLGSVGATVALDDQVVDFLGLSNPIGSRITVVSPGLTGHEKSLPSAWVLAAFGDPASVDHQFVENQEVMPAATPAMVRAARHALSCGALKRAVDDVQKPMSFGQFFTNLGDSFSNTTLVIPADPFAAEKKFCGGPGD
jgi:arabinofuranosyltransferase